MASTPMLPPNPAAGNPNFDGNARATPAPPGTDMTGICFRDQLWLNTYPLDRNLVFDYFALSPFYDWTCNNETIRMRSIHPLDLSHLSKMTGIEYTLSEVTEPHLFVIRKQKRDSPEKVTPMLTYYVLDGSIYQAPQLCNVFASRVGRALYHISKAFTTAASKLEKIGYGGGAFNVIPDSVVIGGSFRTFSKETFVHLKQRIEEVIVGQAAVQRCNATVYFPVKDFCPPTVNDKALHQHFQNVAGDVLGISNVEDMQPLMGSEDFSVYQEAIPGYFYILGMKNETKGKFPSPHSPYFEINEDAFPFGATLHASLTARYLLEIQSENPQVKDNYHEEL